MERLDKILAGTGRWSRREVKELVCQGRVRVDGQTARTAEEKVDPEAAAITVDGQPVETERFTYVMLHKPAGVLSATEDSRQQTVLDLLPGELRRRSLSPVGRLDKDTEGLLLLTNDGALAHRLLAPRSHVDKVYYARVEGALEPADAAAFAAGMTLGDGLECLPAGGRRKPPPPLCEISCRYASFPRNRNGSVRQEIADAPAASYSLAMSRYGKSEAISPFEGDAFFTSQI